MRFTKMHGLGNDYVYVDGFTEQVADPAGLARAISDRHFGVGADGLILILPGQSGDVRMRIFNADGSEAEMCGNGIRCLAKYAYEHGLAKSNPMQVETVVGVKTIELTLGAGGKVTAATVDMGPPVLERHPLFPQRINAHFVEVLARDEVKMRTWERGSGMTLACGTGASAVCVAGVLTGRTDRKITAHLPGGDLGLHWREDTDHVVMTGPAVEVFCGEWPV